MSPANWSSGWQMASLIAGPPLFALAFGFFSPSPLSLGGFADGLCYASLLLLMAWGVLFVIQGQFFTAFWISCKRFFASWRRQESYIRKVEGGQNEGMYELTGQDDVSFHPRLIPHGPFFWAGAGYFAVSFIFSLLFIK